MAPKTAPTPLFATKERAPALEVVAGAPPVVEPAGEVAVLDAADVAGADVAEAGAAVPLLARVKGTVLTPVALPVGVMPAAVH